MDLDKIFNLFNDEYIANDDPSLLVDFSEHPLYWISGFNKIISNHVFFKQYTVNTFKNISTDIDIRELERAGEELMFRKAWDYIKPLDIKKTFHMECLKLKAYDYFVDNLRVAISFFESLEEYEKCAVLKGIEDKVKGFIE